MWHRILICLALVQAVPEPECVSERRTPPRNQSTKTPYAFVAHPDTTPPAPDGCRVAQVWLLARHGTRYPSRKGILGITERLPRAWSAIQEQHERGAGRLCAPTLDGLGRWRPDVEVEDEKRLHPEGEVEMIGLGERYQLRFPELFSSPYRESNYQFRSTQAQRAVQSQFYFAVGLFERPVAQRVAYEPWIQPHDPLIRFYKICDRWLKDVKLNPIGLREARLFEASQLFATRVRQPVSERLGYSRVLSVSEVEDMYVGCLFGQAWHPHRVSPWCNVFTDEEMELMEYREDLESYWIDGPGFPINHRPACILLKDIVANFANVSQGVPTEELGVFYFSHSGSILKFFAFLGLHRDSVDLRHSNYDDDNLRHRRYRTSGMDPFGSNIAFALASCPENDSQSAFKVGMFVNERLTPIPGCDNRDWCDFKHFVQIFEDRLANCNFSNICDLEPGEPLGFSRADVTDDRF